MNIDAMIDEAAKEILRGEDWTDRAIADMKKRGNEEWIIALQSARAACAVAIKACAEEAKQMAMPSIPPADDIEIGYEQGCEAVSIALNAVAYRMKG